MSTATYDEEVEFLAASLVEEPCECGGGPEDHDIRPDTKGHAHAYCKSEES